MNGGCNVRQGGSVGGQHMLGGDLGRGLIGLFWRRALTRLRAFLVHPNESDQVLDPIQ